MIPKAAISVKDSKSVKKVISRLPGREENAMGGVFLCQKSVSQITKLQPNKVVAILEGGAAE